MRQSRRFLILCAAAAAGMAAGVGGWGGGSSEPDPHAATDQAPSTSTTRYAAADRQVEPEPSAPVLQVLFTPHPGWRGFTRDPRRTALER